MTTVATSIKLPASIKKRAETAARRAGLSPHAFMARAIEAEIEASERHHRFVADALAAEREMAATGTAIPLAEARARLAERRGRKSKTQA
jgi:predicted transcriptional regulator